MTNIENFDPTQKERAEDKEATLLLNAAEKEKKIALIELNDAKRRGDPKNRIETLEHIYERAVKGFDELLEKRRSADARASAQKKKFVDEEPVLK
ncbi:MAG TPA: hypothetical protein P5056_01485 [Candidatus Paceibacterota bacterium]|nr:hypothetical protein [Candidatus Paceibacterota bacterium]